MNPKTSPTVSVLLPVFNAEKYLRPALDSVLSQTFRDFELLVINDGSTDRSSAILQDYAEKDARVRVVTRENRGLVATLNEGIDLARGPLLARMDADDIAEANRLREQVAFLQQNVDCVIVGGQVAAIDPEGRRLMSLVKVFEHQDIEEALLEGDAFALIHPAVMLRRATLAKIGGYDTTLAVAEDTDMFLRMARYGRLANLRQHIVKYRMHDRSATHNKRQLARLLTADILERELAARGRVGDTSVVCELRRGLCNGANESRGELFDKWAWWAWAGGERATFLRYAWKAWRSEPWRYRRLHTLLCALRDQVLQ